MTTRSHQPKASEFKEGDRVIYHPVSGSMQTSHGTITKILTHEKEVGIKEPRYLIEDERTSKETVHKSENIVQKSN